MDKLNQIKNDLANYKTTKTEMFKKDVKIKLMNGSALELLPELEEDSIDLVISSPPYCNRYDYTRTYALELAYLGIDETGLKELRQSLLSATVENKEKIEFLRKIYETNNRIDDFNKFENIFSSTKALHEVLNILAKYKDEGKLNNPGIYRMVKNYFYEHAFIIGEMARIIKKGGRIYYVNDNVRYAGETIPVDLILSEFARQSGLKVTKIYKLGRGKGNSSQQMGVHGRQELRKCVYLWEK
jgi:DNA modification methylase